MRPSTRTGAFLPTASLLAVSSVERAQRLATQFVLFFGTSMCCAAALAFVALRTSGEPSTLDAPAMLTLTGLYLSIGVLALGFAWLHHRRYDLQDWQDEGFERALLALLLALFLSLVLLRRVPLQPQLVPVADRRLALLIARQVARLGVEHVRVPRRRVMI